MSGARLAARGAVLGGGPDVIADAKAQCPLASGICPLRLTFRDRLDAANGSRLARKSAPCWQRSFPGEERELGVMRHWLMSVLDCADRAARDDVASIATELAANAVRHTASGQGGWFRVEVTRYRRLVRVAVADEGAPGGPRLVDDPSGEHGRGLLIVARLSRRSGSCGDVRGRLVWADVPADGPEPLLAQGDGRRRPQRCLPYLL